MYLEVFAVAAGSNLCSNVCITSSNYFDSPLLSVRQKANDLATALLALSQTLVRFVMRATKNCLCFVFIRKEQSWN